MHSYMKGIKTIIFNVKNKMLFPNFSNSLHKYKNHLLQSQIQD